MLKTVVSDKKLTIDSKSILRARAPDNYFFLGVNVLSLLRLRG